MLLQRVGFGPAAMTARQALEMATLGGAQVLHRDDIGHLAPGMAADIVAFDIDQIGMAGALHDPVAALIFCALGSVSWSMINGQIIVRDGHLLPLELPMLIERHNMLARQLVHGS